MEKTKIQGLITQAKELLSAGLDTTCPNIGFVRALAALEETKTNEEARYPSTVFDPSLSMETLRAALHRALDLLATAFLAEHPEVHERLSDLPATIVDGESRNDLAALSEYLHPLLPGLSVKQVAAIASMTLDIVIDGLAYADGLASLGRNLGANDSIASVYHTSRIGRRKALGLK